MVVKMRKNIIQGIKNFTVVAGIPILIGSCSCDDKESPLGPSIDEPVLIEASYPEYAADKCIIGKLDYEGLADSAIIDIDGTGYRLKLNPDSSVSVPFEGADGRKKIITKAKGPGGESKADTSYTTKITSMPKAGSLVIAPYINTINLESKVKAENADSMNIGEDLSAQGFVPYNPVFTLTLSSAEGQKTVYAVFKDRMGNLSDTLSAKTDLDITTPSIPATFKDMAINDSSISLGNFSLEGLLDEYYKSWGATSDSGSLKEISRLKLNEGLTYLMVFQQDSAGNMVKDTIQITTTKLDSAQVLSSILAFYAGKGFKPSDSLKQFTATDSSFNSLSETFDYSFDIGSAQQHIKVYSSIPQDIKAAFDYTTGLNRGYGFPDRFFMSGKEFSSSLGEKLLNFYSQNIQ
jgi:hypothetical protein